MGHGLPLGQIFRVLSSAFFGRGLRVRDDPGHDRPGSGMRSGAGHGPQTCCSIRAHNVAERTPFPAPFDSSLRQQEP
jgi:hypothetical protein